MKGYCNKCGIIIDETEIVHHICEFWIDGYFHENWTGKSYFSHERGVYVPMFATERLEKNRIYVDAHWAKKILNPNRVFDATKKNDMLDMCLSKIINVPWIKERSKSLFKVSLP